MINNVSFPKIRDGIDVYIENDNILIFVYLSSRKRIRLKANEIYIKLLEKMNGENSFKKLKYFFDNESDLSDKSFNKFVNYLFEKSIIVNCDWLEKIKLPTNYKNRLEKQFNFLLDVTFDTNLVEKVQSKIYDSQIAVLGIGSVGSWIIRELVMMGFMNFLIIDGDVVEKSDAARHAFFNRNYIGEKKVELVKDELLRLNSKIKVDCLENYLSKEDNVNDILSNSDFIINTADEPYIGYSSLKLSRYCVDKNKPLLVAGGFDAHLGCIGELIIPGKSPCSDCYNNYFTEALKDWKPFSHPVKDRRSSFGGLPSLTAFSASAASMKILKYFMDSKQEVENGRGELLFDDYYLDKFFVKKDKNCSVCGDL